MAFGFPTDDIKATLARADHALDEATAMFREIRETVIIVRTVASAIAAVMMAHKA